MHFIGTFDGDGYAISNFSWTSDGKDHVALFGYVGASGQIKGLTLKNVNISAGTGDIIACLAGENNGHISNCYVYGSTSGECFVAGLVAINKGTIVNCSAISSASGTVDIAGGLVAWNFYGNISNCYTLGAINGSHRVGRLVGNNFSGMISNCYSKCTVSGTDKVGGLIGSNHGAWHNSPISNTYSTGTVNGNNYLGGLIGFGDPNDVFLSFWDIEKSGQMHSSGGVPKHTTSMKEISTFIDAGWDFSSPIWKICNGTNYPKLNWQKPVLGDFICPDGIDLFDFDVLAQDWLRSQGDSFEYPDITGDGKVKLDDLIIFVNNWLIESN